VLKGKIIPKNKFLGRRLLEKTITKVLKTIIVVEHVRMRDKHQKWLLISSNCISFQAFD